MASCDDDNGLLEGARSLDSKVEHFSETIIQDEHFAGKTSHANREDLDPALFCAAAALLHAVSPITLVPHSKQALLKGRVR